MSANNRIAGDAALACSFIIIHAIRHALRDEELETVFAVFKEIHESVIGAIQAALEHEGG